MFNFIVDVFENRNLKTDAPDRTVPNLLRILPTKEKHAKRVHNLKMKSAKILKRTSLYMDVIKTKY